LGHKIFITKKFAISDKIIESCHARHQQKKTTSYSSFFFLKVIKEHMLVGLFRKSLVAHSSTSTDHQLGLETFDVVFEIENHPNHIKI
jgi:hypothetical protein